MTRVNSPPTPHWRCALRGGWLRLKTGAQVVSGAVAVLSSGVVWVTFALQLVSLEPC